MKSILIYTVCALSVVCGSACQRMNSESNVSFSTPEEAANQAKTHLLSLMQSEKEMALGIDAAAVEKSRPATPLKHFQVTFNELLSADSFAKFTGNELATVVPLITDNNVVTTAEVAKGEKGWRITALADKGLSDELNTVLKAAGDQSEIVIYDLPHAQTRVYAVSKRAGGDQAAGPTLHTNYPGFNLREGVPVEQLLTVLKRDAAEFQAKHGDALKSQKLTN